MRKTTIEGWIVRDMDGTIRLYTTDDVPEKVGTCWFPFIRNIILPSDAFLSVKWEDEPTKVEVTIEIKEE